jgi:hypothetical protein
LRGRKLQKLAAFVFNEAGTTASSDGEIDDRSLDAIAYTEMRISLENGNTDSSKRKPSLATE